MIDYIIEPDEILTLGAIKLYLNLPFVCQREISKIEPGYGYTGVVQKKYNDEINNIIANQGNVNVYKPQSKRTHSSELKYIYGYFHSTITEDLIKLKNLLDVSNWKTMDTRGYIYAIEKNYESRRNKGYPPLFIPYDKKKIVIQSWKLLEEACFNIKDSSWSSNKNIVSLIIDGENTSIIGIGDTDLEAAIDLFQKCFKINYEFNRPSITELRYSDDLEFLISNDILAVLCHSRKAAAQFHYPKFLDYGRGNFDEIGYNNKIGEINFIEGLVEIKADY